MYLGYTDALKGEPELSPSNPSFNYFISRPNSYGL